MVRRCKVTFNVPTVKSLRGDGLRAAVESHVSQLAGLAHAAEQRCGRWSGSPCVITGP